MVEEGEGRGAGLTGQSSCESHPSSLSWVGGSQVGVRVVFLCFLGNMS